MSKKAESLFQKLGNGIERAGKEIVAEIERQGTLGNSELAAALFKEHDGFVLYGPNARPAVAHDHDIEHSSSVDAHAPHQSQSQELEMEREL